MSGGPTTYFTYSGGTLSSIEDADGNSTHFSYSADGDILTTTYSDPSITGLENDPHTMQTFPEVAPRGRLYARSASGPQPSFATAKVISADELFEREGRFTDELGRVSTYEVNDAGYVSKMTDATGRVTTYSRNSAGQVTTVRLSDGSGTTLDRTTYTFDPQRNLTDVTYFDGTSEHWTFDTVENHSRPLSYTDPLGRETIYTYTEFAGGAEETMTVRQVVGQNDLSSSETDDLVTTYEYDAMGQLVEVREKRVDFDGTSLDDVVTIFDYVTYTIQVPPQPEGQPIGKWLQSITYAVGTADEATVQVLELDDYGNPIRILDEAGQATEYEYDALDRLTKIIDDPDDLDPGPSPITRFTYTGTGRLESQVETSDATSPVEIETRFNYDHRGRLEQVIENYDNGTYDPQDVENDIYTDFFYDAAGQLTRILDPLERETHFYYDLLGRPVRVTEPDPDGATGSAHWSLHMFASSWRSRCGKDKCR
jgi:YD repeat-containing protein